MSASPFGKLSLREAIVDLLGALIPGIIFICVSLLTISWPVWALLREVVFLSPQSQEGVNFLLEVLRFFRTEVTVLMLISAYVVGHLFFRLDPKKPDQKSFDRTEPYFDEVQRRTWCVRKDAQGESDIQFPYRFLREYLADKELHHLANLVPWHGTDPSTHNWRTKTFINMLKMRVLFHFPDRYADIAKNEGHVRLMSSLWYVVRSLKSVSYGAVGLILVSVVLAWSSRMSFPLDNLLALGTTFVLFGTFLGVQVAVERFFHYMRVRETIFVLETAFIASKKEKAILRDLR